MPDLLLLRFRDLLEGKDTIDEHNRIVKKNGSVFWGWWKKPLELMPVSSLHSFAQEDHSGAEKILLIDSATRKLYQAPLYKVIFNPVNEIPCPHDTDATVCPKYYKEKLLFAWFRIGRIREVKEGYEYLNDFVWSKYNRTDFEKPTTALSEGVIGERVTDIDFLDNNVSLWFVTPVDEIELRSRENLVSSFSSVPWRVEGQYIIHLSDIHFGANHAYRNHLAKRSGPRVAKECLADVLIQDFEAMALDINKIALIVVTGDITWESNAHEFANAKAFLESLSRKFGLHPAQIVVAPGNHDIEWMEGKDDLNEDAELNYRNFCRDLYGTQPNDSFLRIHRFNIIGRNISVISLNSCRLESKENAGLGYVGREQLRAMLRYVCEKGLREDLTIALVHHHLLPVNYIEEIDWKQKRVSIMLDADDVLRNLICARVRMVLHGHQHQPYVSEIRRIIKGFVNPFDSKDSDLLDGTIAIVGGGSIGVNRSHINFVGRNTYNIIDLDPQSEVSDSPQILLKTRMQSPVGPGFITYQETLFNF